MKLESIKYFHGPHGGKINEWDLDNFTLRDTNLIVGKNATGKTKTLNIIKNLASLLKGARKPDFSSAHFDAHFLNEKKHYRYILLIENGAVIKEVFEIEGENFLNRTDTGRGEIFAEKEGKRTEFHTPVSELAFTVRRDNLQHPYFEPLYLWATSIHFYAFGTPLGRDTFPMFGSDDGIPESDLKDYKMVVSIYRQGEKNIGDPFKKAIKDDLKSIGYDISDIGIEEPSNLFAPGRVTGGPVGLWVQENDLKQKTEQNEISQGMFRALSLVIQLNYSKMTHIPSCILIDDIGEGLDFERSCSLIELLMSKTSESNIQLIMTTNDRFIMNKVPLEAWIVLLREGAHCKVFNMDNSAEQFKAFQFTGLNNFDFFATDYLKSAK